MGEDRTGDAAGRWPIVLRRLLLAGWACLLLSALCLYFSAPLAPGNSRGGEVAWAPIFMLARLAGTVAFAIGGVAIFNRRWLEGIAMCLLAVVLPFVSFFVHGTI